MFYLIVHHEKIVKKCEGCGKIGTAPEGGDNTKICRLHPQPRTRWWFNQKCEDYYKRSPE